MPRWYYLLILRAANFISIAFLIVVALIALCAAADWIWHLGWGYNWLAAVGLPLFAMVGYAVNRVTSAAIQRAK